MTSTWILLIMALAVSYPSMGRAQLGLQEIAFECVGKTAICKIHNGTIEGVIRLSTVGDGIIPGQSALDTALFYYYTAIKKFISALLLPTLNREVFEPEKFPVQVTGEISGLSTGKHGFHVHQFGDLSNGCLGAGGHYNPFKKDHGGPTDADRHVGDLGNVEAIRDEVTHIDITDTELRLCGPLSIMGRAIVVHAKEDDLGTGGNEESKKTGNAGARIGCCIIGTTSQ